MLFFPIQIHPPPPVALTRLTPLMNICKGTKRVGGRRGEDAEDCNRTVNDKMKGKESMVRKKMGKRDKTMDRNTIL